MTDEVHVDRRAAAAVDALDAAFDDVFADADPARVLRDVHARSAAGRHRPRRRAVLAVAAAIAVVAVTGALASFGSGDDRGTTAGEGDAGVIVTAREIFALDEPGAAGFAVHTATLGNPATGRTWIATAVHVPAGDDWDNAVATSTYPYAEEHLVGRVVDAAGTEFVIPPRPIGVVQWRSGDSVHSLSAGRLDIDTLVSVAADAVTRGWDGTGPLPGHRVAHVLTGPVGYFDPSAISADTAAVFYEPLTDTAAGFVIASSPGSQERWRAGHVPARQVYPLAVAGHDGTVAEFHDGTATLKVLSWLTADGTLVEAATYGNVGTMADVLDEHLTSVDISDFRRLADRHPGSEHSPGLGRPDLEAIDTIDFFDVDHDFGKDATPIPTGERVRASLATRVGDRDVHAIVVSDRDRSMVQTMVMDRSGSGGGSGREIYDSIEFNVHQGWLGTASGSGRSAERSITGVVPDGAAVTGVRSATPGTPVEVLRTASTPVAGQDRQLILCIVRTDPSAMALLIDIVDTDGEPVTLRV